MDINRKIRINLNISMATATMLELAVQEFVRTGGKLGDGLAVNEPTREELLEIAQEILNQIADAR